MCVSNIHLGICRENLLKQQISQKVENCGGALSGSVDLSLFK